MILAPAHYLAGQKARQVKSRHILAENHPGLPPLEPVFLSGLSLFFVKTSASFLRKSCFWRSVVDCDELVDIEQISANWICSPVSIVFMKPVFLGVRQIP
jgi:hypothetical protein